MSEQEKQKDGGYTIYMPLCLAKAAKRLGKGKGMSEGVRVALRRATNRKERDSDGSE